MGGRLRIAAIAAVVFAIGGGVASAQWGAGGVVASQALMQAQ